MDGRTCDVGNYLGGGVAASAAQRVAAVGSVGGRAAAALAVSGPDAAAVGVGTAVVRRPLDVDQFRVADRLSALSLLASAQ